MRDSRNRPTNWDSFGDVGGTAAAKAVCPQCGMEGKA